jgi:hypothetical protein
MRTYIGFCLAMFLIAPVFASSNWLANIHECDTLRTASARTICTRVTISRELLRNYTPMPVSENGQLRRQIYLTVWGPHGDPKIVLITVPFVIKTETNVPVTVHTPGFTVTHVRGQYAYKIEFTVHQDSVPYQVYGGTHVWIPNGYSGPRSLAELKRVAEVRTYLPFQDHLFDLELARRGKTYVHRLTLQAREKLRHIDSKVFRGRSIADTHDEMLLLALIMSEHSDADKIFKPDTRLTLSRENYLLGVLIEIALHGTDAFREVSSSADARGWTQFTNRPSGAWPGTYRHTYENCRNRDGTPVLIEDFGTGAQDPINSIIAAYCYLDFELSQLPKEAWESYRKDQRLGSMLMLVAFNAGNGWSKWVHRQLHKMPHKSSLTHETLPRHLFVRGSRTNSQSYYYVRKYWWSLELLNQLK